MKLSYYFLFLLICVINNALIFPQNNIPSKFKTEALQLMNSGRYGEAIDLLNKYVSAVPRSAEGFNLRGICYEKRSDYENAVYDFRTAKKLNPSDDDITSNLNRTTSNWHKILYNKIEGHKREIAINPSIAKNYLEIGKCYKNLGEWKEAEIWYDQYLEKQFASSDEIIRYSEILAKNNHIAKGEPILKKYTEMFPDDHRLLSRYGYFLLWLGKNKKAIDAFNESLIIRPYFKEAIDGLDLAKGKGYIYSINDTSARYNYGLPGSKHVYIIDKYFRMLIVDPSDDETRFKLIEELIKVNRYEEAYQQLSILSSRYNEETRFNDLWFKVITLRKSYYADRISYYEDLLSKNPKDKKVLLELAKFYTYNQDYDLAVNLYHSYLVNYLDDDEVQYKLAQILMWQNNLCEAAEVSRNLVQKEPTKIEYLLLAAKINQWLEEDVKYSQSLYEKVLSIEPSNTEAIFGLGNLLINVNDLSETKNLIDKISAKDSSSQDYNLLVNRYNESVENNKLIESFKILEDARKFSLEKNYDLSIKYFNNYLSHHRENESVKLELADVYVANNQLDESIKIYKSILKSKNDYEIEKRLAKVYLWNQDSLLALKEFINLNQMDPQDVETKLLLGDAYLQAGQLENARTIYEELLIQSPDSYILKTRMGWLGGSNKFSFNNFPTYVQLIPRASYFVDNTDFSYSNYGFGFDLGTTNFLTIGLSGSRGKLSSKNEGLRFNQIKGNGYVRLNKIFSVSVSFGQTYFANDLAENILELSLKAFKENSFKLNAFMNFSDAAFILYSPYLVNNRLHTYQFGLNGEYIFKNKLIVSAKYFYLDVSDNNEGNQFIARLGKSFDADVKAGYEYYYYNFAFSTLLYWSPNNFEAHSIWADWILYKDNSVNFSIGGKVGLIPKNDFVLSEFYAGFDYQIVSQLLFQTRYTTGSSFRSNVGYRSNSLIASIIWNL